MMTMVMMMMMMMMTLRKMMVSITIAMISLFVAPLAAPTVPDICFTTYQVAWRPFLKPVRPLVERAPLSSVNALAC